VSTMKRMSSLVGVARKFWAVADLFRESVTWIPTNAGYELRNVMEVDGKRWARIFKVHVYENSDPREGVYRLVFRSSITIWPPPDLTKAEARKLRVKGWYKDIEKTVSRGGYRGEWNSSPYGLFGDFWKDLGSPSEIRLEAKLLEKIHLALQSSSPKRPFKSRSKADGKARRNPRVRRV
jgi:hypothetical protein